jgi:hypothetical protein
VDLLLPRIELQALSSCSCFLLNSLDPETPEVRVQFKDW